MNKPQAEAALTHLDTAKTEIAPVYDAYRESTVQHLLANRSVTGQSLVDAEIGRRNNFKIVTSFVDNLPPYIASGASCYATTSFTTGTRYYRSLAVEADAEFAAQHLPAHLLWLETSAGALQSSSQETTLTPFYIVGERQNTMPAHTTEDKAATDLMLCAASAQSGPKDTYIKTVTVLDGELKVAREAALGIALKPFLDEEVAAMFDADAMRFVVPFREGAMHSSKLYTSFEPAHYKKVGSKTVKNGLSVVRNGSDETKRIADDVMTNFNVMDRLEHLAVAFGKTDALRKLLERIVEQGSPEA